LCYLVSLTADFHTIIHASLLHLYEKITKRLTVCENRKQLCHYKWKCDSPGQNILCSGVWDAGWSCQSIWRWGEGGEVAVLRYSFSLASFCVSWWWVGRWEVCGASVFGMGQVGSFGGHLFLIGVGSSCTSARELYTRSFFRIDLDGGVSGVGCCWEFASF
jgi:hypothetical protein